jgi:hypothetical protein
MEVMHKKLYHTVAMASKEKLRDFGPLANYADRPSDRRLLAK